jgi:hypothetical protein
MKRRRCLVLREGDLKRGEEKENGREEGDGKKLIFERRKKKGEKSMVNEREHGKQQGRGVCGCV